MKYGAFGCWINREDGMFASEEGKKLMKDWNLPEGLMGHPFIINLLHQKHRFNSLPESLSFIRKRFGTDAFCITAVFQRITHVINQ